VSDIRRVECDRCGRQEDSPQYGEGKSGRLILPAHWKYLEALDDGGVDSLDLCPECYGGFREWVKGGKRRSEAERG